MSCYDSVQAYVHWGKACNPESCVVTGVLRHAHRRNWRVWVSCSAQYLGCAWTLKYRLCLQDKGLSSFHSGFSERASDTVLQTVKHVGQRVSS